jgi:hypothetical protein
MAKRKPVFTLRFTPKDPGAAFEKIIPKFLPKWEDEMKDFANTAKGRVKDRIPVGARRRHGRQKSTKATIGVKSSFNKKTMNGSINITGSEVVKFLDKGTKRSPGKYLPFAHRRLRQGQPNIGFHPGIRALNIIQEAKNDIENDAKDTIKQLQRHFKFSIREAFRT